MPVHVISVDSQAPNEEGNILLGATSFDISRTEANVTINGYTTSNISSFSLIVTNNNNSLVIAGDGGKVLCYIIPGTHAVVVNSVTFSGTASTLKDLLLNDIFPELSLGLQQIFDIGATFNKDNSINTGEYQFFVGEDGKGIFLIKSALDSYFEDTVAQKSHTLRADATGTTITCWNDAPGGIDTEAKFTNTIATWKKNNIIRNIASIRPEDDFSNDAAAATGGIEVNQFYHTSGVIKIRLT